MWILLLFLSPVPVHFFAIFQPSFSSDPIRVVGLGPIDIVTTWLSASVVHFGSTCAASAGTRSICRGSFTGSSGRGFHFGAAFHEVRIHRITKLPEFFRQEFSKLGVREARRADPVALTNDRFCRFLERHVLLHQSPNTIVERVDEFAAAVRF